MEPTCQTADWLKISDTTPPWDTSVHSEEVVYCIPREQERGRKAFTPTLNPTVAPTLEVRWLISADRVCPSHKMAVLVEKREHPGAVVPVRVHGD